MGEEGNTLPMPNPHKQKIRNHKNRSSSLGERKALRRKESKRLWQSTGGGLICRVWLPKRKRLRSGPVGLLLLVDSSNLEARGVMGGEGTGGQGGDKIYHGERDQESVGYEKRRHMFTQAKDKGAK